MEQTSASAVELKPPKDFSHLLSEVSKARKASSIKKFYRFFQPGVGNLAGGK
jgi:site-specific recombinase XerD